MQRPYGHKRMCVSKRYAHIPASTTRMHLNADELTLHSHNPQMSTKRSTGTPHAPTWYLCTRCCTHTVSCYPCTPARAASASRCKECPHWFSFFVVCSVSSHLPLLSQQFSRKELFQEEKINLLICHGALLALSHNC